MADARTPDQTETGTATPADPAPSHRDNPTDNTVQLSRSRVGAVVVVAGDVVIAAAALTAIIELGKSKPSVATIVAILTSAFTAISTMTTAYFGIKTMSNTAQSFAKQMPAPAHHPSPGEPGETAIDHSGQAGGGQPAGEQASSPAP
jgi:hypothetical protein